MIRQIKVIADDIAKGERKDCFHCPIALAIAREIGVDGRNRNVGVGYDFVNIYFTENPSVKGSIDLPQGVPTKINLYDLTGEMEPFEFPLDIPDFLINRGNNVKE